MLAPCAVGEWYEAQMINDEADAQMWQPSGKVVDLVRADLKL